MKGAFWIDDRDTIKMKISIAIIGSGTSARERHIPAYLSVPDAQVVAIADNDADTARSTGQKFGIKNVYDDYEVMLKRRRPDLVSVCVSPSERKDAVVFALSRGAHVLCEMPLGMSTEEGKAMIEAADKYGKTLIFAAPLRFEAPAASVKAAIVNGDLGQVCYCRVWCRRSAVPADDFWQIKTNQGGGALSVSGQEMLDLALWLTDDLPVSVSGSSCHRFKDSPEAPKTWFGSRKELDAEDLMAALVRCEKSVVAAEVDWLYGDDETGALVVGTRGRGSTSPFRTDVASQGRFVDMTPTFLPETVAWQEQVKSFIEAALGHGKPFPSTEEALRVQQIADAVRQSSQDGREVRLSER